MERDDRDYELSCEERLEQKYIECLDLSEELLARFERNDPSLLGLSVQADCWIKGAGHAFFKCKFLKKLNILLNSDDTRWFVELCAGIAYNRTIVELQLIFDQDGGNGVDAFCLLAPFIRINPNLRCITIINDIGLLVSKLGSIASALIERESGQLKKISIDWNQPTSDEEVAELFESLRGEHNLRNLTFNNANLDVMGCTKLSNLLKNPSSKIISLDLKYSDISSDCLDILCNGITTNNTLRSLNLSEMMSSLSLSSCVSVSMILSKRLSSLQELRLSHNDIGDEGIAILGEALAINTTLQHIDLNNSISITLKGWQAFSNCLRNPKSALQELILWGCNIDEQGAATFAIALAGNASLRVLDLDHNAIESAGLVTFFDILWESESVLEKLCINFIDFRDIAEEEWCVFSRALCDTTTIGSTYSSNHTFHSCEFSDDIDSDGCPCENILDEVLTLMDMNSNPDKAEVARRKILFYHFLYQNSGIHELACMHETVLPHVIEWMGRDEHGYSALFSFVKSFPSMFDVSCVA